MAATPLFGRHINDTAAPARAYTQQEIDALNARNASVVDIERSGAPEPFVRDDDEPLMTQIESAAPQSQDALVTIAYVRALDKQLDIGRVLQALRLLSVVQRWQVVVLGLLSGASERFTSTWLQSLVAVAATEYADNTDKALRVVADMPQYQFDLGYARANGHLLTGAWSPAVVRLFAMTCDFLRHLWFEAPLPVFSSNEQLRPFGANSSPFLYVDMSYGDKLSYATRLALALIAMDTPVGREALEQRAATTGHAGAPLPDTWQPDTSATLTRVTKDDVNSAHPSFSLHISAAPDTCAQALRSCVNPVYITCALIETILNHNKLHASLLIAVSHAAVQCLMDNTQKWDARMSRCTRAERHHFLRLVSALQKREIRALRVQLAAIKEDTVLIGKAEHDVRATV